MNYTYKNLGREGYGRLGNQMWQIAWAVGSAEKSGGRAFVVPSWEYRKFFSVPEEAYETPKGKCVDGESNFFQELYHWEDSVDTVKKWFTPSDYANKLTDELVPQAGKNTIAVHFRRGDYLNNPHMFPVPTYSYYELAIKEALAQNDKSKLIVFSDDFDWVTNLFQNDQGLLGILYKTKRVTIVKGIERSVDPSKRVGEPRDIVDLVAMTRCDRHVIANSTFSWWGAFLADSLYVTYPSVWFGDGIKSKDIRGIRVTESWKDGIPSDWIKVKC